MVPSFFFLHLSGARTLTQSMFAYSLTLNYISRKIQQSLLKCWVKLSPDCYSRIHLPVFNVFVQLKFRPYDAIIDLSNILLTRF